tara:strand:+ start:286 stop:390 length:105 start_codon:yes stop_codon:yes gene_type:complete
MIECISMLIVMLGVGMLSTLILIWDNLPDEGKDK